MDIHLGLRQELVNLAIEECFATACRERRAVEASQGSRQERPGIVRNWLSRLGSPARQADHQRIPSRAAKANLSAPAQ